MDDQEKRQNGFEEDDTSSDSSSTAMLKILNEKDKIIVSLKESSTQRDKLNESQIRLLSEDNDKKNRKIEQLNDKLSSLHSNYMESSSKLELYKERVDQSTEKFDELKTVLKEYKANISHTLGSISDMVAGELTSREERNSKLADQLHTNYRKLEERLEKLDTQHKNTLDAISQKQGQAKNLIRDAVKRLQNALDLLDLGSADLQLDSRVMDDFNSILRDSEAAFTDLNSTVRETGTIIKKIQTLNLQLTETPQLDNHFSELGARMKGIKPAKNTPGPSPIPGPAESSREDLDAFLEEAYQMDAPAAAQPASPSTGGGGTGPTAGSGSAPDGGSAIAPSGPQAGPGQGPMQGPPGQGPMPGSPTASLTPPAGNGQTVYYPVSMPFQGGQPGPATETGTPFPGSGGGAIPFQGNLSAPGGMAPGFSGGAGSGFAGGNLPSGGFPGGNSSGYGAAGGISPGLTGSQQQTGSNAPRTASGNAGTMVMDSPGKESTIKPDDDLIMRESPNLAPYNWDMLPATSPMLRFRRLLNNAKKAEHRENYTKALAIYEVVKQQRTIQDDALATNMLEDQIEAINRLARAQVSNNKKRESVERYYRRERTDDKRHNNDQD